MHVAGHGRVHLHEDGTRHIHKGGKQEGRKHVHKDGTTHDHKTGEHLHKDGKVHQHEPKNKKSKMCMDEMACCPPEGMKKAACCPSCGNAACTCCKMDKPAGEVRPGKLPFKLPVDFAPAAPEAPVTEGAGTIAPSLSVQTLGLPLLTWLKNFF